MVAWLLDTGVWLALAVLVALGVFFWAWWLIGRGGAWVAARLERHELLAGMVARTGTATTLVRLAVGVIIVGAMVLALLDILAVDISPALEVLRRGGAAVAAWFLTGGLRVFLVIVLAYVSYQVLRRGAPRLVEGVILKDKTGLQLEEAEKRAMTLSGVAVGVGAVLVVLVAGFMVLAELGVNVGPMLAGFGIAGIAVGFGAQHLVRDVITGIFVLLEDQYRVGDVASVGGKTGLVEAVNLRRTVLRDLDGIVHVIPNGEASVISNYTKDFSRVNLDVPVAYRTDLDHAFAVLNRVGRELAEDEYFGPLIMEAPQVVRVSNLGDSSIDIKMVGVTKPIRQWEVTGELRKRIKKAFDEEGIEIPFPHRTIYWGVASHPLRGDSLEPTGQEKAEHIRAALRGDRPRPPKEDVARDLPEERDD